MTTEDSSEGMPDKVPLCKGELHCEEMERVMPINVDPMSCTLDTGWDKRGRKAGHMVNTVLNDSGIVENKMWAKELMEKLMDSIKFKGEWCEWEEQQGKCLDHFWALGAIMCHMLCGRPSVDGDKGKEEFCQNTNLGMTREPDNHGKNNEKSDEWGRL